MSNFPFPGVLELQTPVSDALSRRTKLTNHKKSNSLWEGVGLGPYRDGLEYMPEAAASARMIFSNKSDGVCTKLVLSSVDGKVHIIGSPDNWLFGVVPQNLPLDVGMWFWTFEVVDVVGNNTQVANGTLLVVP